MPRMRKMGRKIGPRRALLRNQVTSLLKIERMETTEAKAREVKRLTDKMITLAKRGDLHARRQALAFLMDEDVVTKLFEKIGPRMEARNGGYTRMTKLYFRRGDGASMVLLELTS
ncbi:MAG: 50S ribosomal protein L17 [Firmicutes bacterium]|nr:50S ribosomal protein L17 [Bacillota bacterium]